jgi:AcrR family transcriptional regulator
MRADAERNRQRILETARTVITRDGLSVPVAEIARQAGVGTGTVCRHFPAKEDLYEAILGLVTAEIAEHGRKLGTGGEPGETFFAFFDFMVERAGVNLGLRQAMSGAAFDLQRAGAQEGDEVSVVTQNLLSAAQSAGAVRADLTVGDVRALLVGCSARPQGPADPEARQRMVDIAVQGMRNRTDPRSAEA